MTLDFVQVIEGHVDGLPEPWTAKEKTALLDDWCYGINYSGFLTDPETNEKTAITKRAFVNRDVKLYGLKMVNSGKDRRARDEATAAVVPTEMED